MSALVTPVKSNMKRKSSQELSQNHHTVKSRARKARLDPMTKEIKTAKDNDRSAVKYSKSVLKKTPQWIQACPEQQRQLEQDDKQRVIARRYVD